MPPGAACAIQHGVDAAAHYRHLIALGRTEFLAVAAPAALVRFASPARAGFESSEWTGTLDEVRKAGGALRGSPDGEIEVFPLAKKPGASFPDRITIGRTHHNDVVIGDASVSRLHAYARPHASGWVVADAGSKNGSWLDGGVLEARRETALPSRGLLRLGDVELTFFVASDLFSALGGSL